MNDTKVALIDDHQLLRNSLGIIIDKFPGYHVISESDNGKDFISHFRKNEIPDIILLDIHMPVMDGFETAEWLKKNLPTARILVLSMMDNDASVIKMIHLGARGYILKDSKPAILKEAFDSIMQKGYYSNDLVNSKMFNFLNPQNNSIVSDRISITEREQEFLRLACSEMTYKEIAHQMEASPRTLENYRDSLFKKFDLKSRVGLVLFAIKEGYYKL